MRKSDPRSTKNYSITKDPNGTFRATNDETEAALEALIKHQQQFPRDSNFFHNMVDLNKEDANLDENNESTDEKGHREGEGATQDDYENIEELLKTLQKQLAEKEQEYESAILKNTDLQNINKALNAKYDELKTKIRQHDFGEAPRIFYQEYQESQASDPRFKKLAFEPIDITAQPSEKEKMKHFLQNFGDNNSGLTLPLPDALSKGQQQGISPAELLMTNFYIFCHRIENNEFVKNMTRLVPLQVYFTERKEQFAVDHVSQLPDYLQPFSVRRKQDHLDKELSTLLDHLFGTSRHVHENFFLEFLTPLAEDYKPANDILLLVNPGKNLYFFCLKVSSFLVDEESTKASNKIFLEYVPKYYVI